MNRAQIRVGLWLKTQGFVSNLNVISLDVPVWHYLSLLVDANELLGLIHSYYGPLWLHNCALGVRCASMA